MQMVGAGRPSSNSIRSPVAGLYRIILTCRKGHRSVEPHPDWNSIFDAAFVKAIHLHNACAALFRYRLELFNTNERQVAVIFLKYSHIAGYLVRKLILRRETIGVEIILRRKALSRLLHTGTLPSHAKASDENFP